MPKMPLTNMCHTHNTTYSIHVHRRAGCAAFDKYHIVSIDEEKWQHLAGILRGQKEARLRLASEASWPGYIKPYVTVLTPAPCNTTDDIWPSRPITFLLSREYKFLFTVSWHLQYHVRRCAFRQAAFDGWPSRVASGRVCPLRLRCKTVLWP